MYRMSTVTGNLYVVDELCITEVEWAPYKFYLRPLDDDLVNSKGSHSPPPPISYLYTKSQPGSAVEALFDQFLRASRSSEPSLEVQSATVFDICCINGSSLHAPLCAQDEIYNCFDKLNHKYKYFGVSITCKILARLRLRLEKGCPCSDSPLSARGCQSERGKCCSIRPRKTSARLRPTLCHSA